MIKIINCATARINQNEHPKSETTPLVMDGNISDSRFSSLAKGSKGHHDDHDHDDHEHAEKSEFNPEKQKKLVWAAISISVVAIIVAIVAIVISMLLMKKVGMDQNIADVNENLVSAA